MSERLNDELVLIWSLASGTPVSAEDVYGAEPIRPTTVRALTAR